MLTSAAANSRRREPYSRRWISDGCRVGFGLLKGSLFLVRQNAAAAARGLQLTNFIGLDM